MACMHAPFEIPPCLHLHHSQGDVLYKHPVVLSVVDGVRGEGNDILAALF